jgi:hypothetical protein
MSGILSANDGSNKSGVAGKPPLTSVCYRSYAVTPNPTTTNEPPRRKGRKGLNFSFLGVLGAFAVTFPFAQCMTCN